MEQYISMTWLDLQIVVLIASSISMLVGYAIAELGRKLSPKIEPQKEE